MRQLLILCLLLSFCASFWAAPVVAQGRRKKKLVFDTETETETRDPVGKPRERDPIGDAISRLSGWPSNRARRAAEMLVVQKERSIERIVGVLVGQTESEIKLKPGAAYVLGRIGDKTNAMTLILVAAENEQHRFARVFLEAAYELDPDRAVDEAFRFFHLRATTLRQQAVKFVRAVASLDCRRSSSCWIVCCRPTRSSGRMYPRRCIARWATVRRRSRAERCSSARRVRKKRTSRRSTI